MVNKKDKKPKLRGMIKNKIFCFKESLILNFKISPLNNMIFLKYDTNPNGSIDNIAGLVDYKTKTLALMPHPERAVFKNLNNGCDGRLIFEFFKELI